MNHKKCGGKFVRISKTETESVYQCNRCGVVRSVYSKNPVVATGGSPKEVNK